MPQAIWPSLVHTCMYNVCTSMYLILTSIYLYVLCLSWYIHGCTALSHVLQDFVEHCVMQTRWCQMSSSLQQIRTLTGVVPARRMKILFFLAGAGCRYHGRGDWQEVYGWHGGTGTWWLQGPALSFLDACLCQL